jgi:hypothetical protein
MKTILLSLLLLILPIQMKAQQKPFNTINELTYNNDKSITLKFNSNTIVTIKGDNDIDFQTFRFYFEQADILAKYCSLNSKTDVTKSLGKYKDFEFVYVFKYNSIGGTSMLDVIYLVNDYSSYPIHINFIQLNNKFIDYLTTYRDKYYQDLKVYNNNLHKIKGSIDSLVRNNK